jgi:hypothetical protein
MDEFVCLVVVSNAGEPQPDFAARLSRFWTHMLRTRKGDFEKVYAETTSFDRVGDKLMRQYLVEASVLPILESEMRAAGVGHEPIDPDELYSKYEAVTPDWMQIEH